MPIASTRWTLGRQAIAGIALGGVLGVAGCFDSDDKFKAAPVETTGSTGIIDPSTTSTGLPPPPSTTDGGTTTCRDAIECVNACILSIPLMNVPEPDLSCFLECDSTLSVQEALTLLRLFECAYQRCVDAYTDANGEPLCNPDGGTTGAVGSSSDGGAGSSSGGSDSGSGTAGSSSSDGGTPPPPPSGPLDPCTTCVITVVSDQSECPDLQSMCQ